MKIMTVLIPILLLTVLACYLTDNPPKTIHMAAFKGNLRAVERFLESGVDVNAKAKGAQEGPLHFAVHGNQIRMVMYLLDHGADINLRNTQGDTPLHAAAWSGHTPILKLLLQKGGNPGIKNQDGKTVMDYADERHHQDVTDLLSSFSSQPRDSGAGAS